MRNLILITALGILGCSLVGCSPQTPEEAEAAKYGKVKQNTPEEEKAMRERLHLGQPLTGPTGMGVPPQGGEPGRPGTGAPSPGGEPGRPGTQ